MKEKSFDIYHDVSIKVSPEKVFAAVSDPRQLVNWWPKICTGKKELGAVYRLFFTEEYDWLAEVLRYEPDLSFHMRMIKSDEDWASTSFGFDLSSEEDGTLLNFWHKGWPELNHHYRRSNWCWALLLKGLKDYLEKGELIPFEHRA